MRLCRARVPGNVFKINQKWFCFHFALLPQPPVLSQGWGRDELLPNARFSAGAPCLSWLTPGIRVGQNGIIGASWSSRSSGCRGTLLTSFGILECGDFGKLSPKSSCCFHCCNEVSDTQNICFSSPSYPVEYEMHRLLSYCQYLG